MQEQNLGSGVWVKTHFYRKGHMLHSVTYCVAQGNPEVIRLSIDLRPVAQLVKRYHDKLHAEKRTNPDGHSAKQKVSGIGLFNFDGKTLTPNMQPGHGGFLGSISAPFKGIGHAVESVGKSTLLRKAGSLVAKVATKAGGLAMTVSPVNLVKHVLKGERLDHAVLGDLKDKIKAAKTAAPYVQAVVSMVPGVGTGVAGAIAASAALAEGHTITDAMIAGVRGAVPGGALAQMAFDTAAALARGKSLDKAALEAARNQVPAAARAAWDTGYAIAHGQKLQNVVKAALPAAGAAGVSLAAVPKVSTAALSAFTTAHEALDAIEGGKLALRAVQNVKNAAELVDKANKAVKAIGPEAAQKSLAAHPALASKLKTAVAVKNAANQIPKAHIEEAKKRALGALTAIKRIQEQAAGGNVDAQKSLAILNVVAAQRGHVQAVANANAGGIPGIQIDPSGRLIRGRFVRTTAGPESYLYTHRDPQGGRGHWSRVSTDATADPATAAVLHAELAKAHHAAAGQAVAEKKPDAASAHRKKAAVHAKQALANKAKAKAKISGLTTPGLIGCACQH